MSTSTASLAAANSDSSHSYILIGTHDPLLLEQLQATLDDKDLQLQVVPSGNAVLHQVQQSLPDLLLLDSQLPDLNGLEVATRLQKTRYSCVCPVLLLVTNRIPQEQLWVLQRQGIDYLVRPFKPQQLRDHVVPHLQLSQLLCHLRQLHNSSHDQVATLSNQLAETTGLLAAEQQRRQQAEYEQQRLTDELAKNNANFDQFTATVAHDLRNPLFSIKSLSQRFSVALARNQVEQAQHQAQLISKATDQLEKILDHLLQLTLTTRSSLPQQPVSLTEVAHEAYYMLESLIDKTHVAVVIHKLPVVQADRAKLLEVFLNLLENALRAVRDQEHPRVEIRTQPSADGPVIAIRDNGPGIPPEHHNKVFQPFVQLKTDGNGTGIGLAIVQRIIDFYGGRIWIESQGNGDGASFCFTLGKPTT